jgi:hypothetical protein
MRSAGRTPRCREGGRKIAMRDVYPVKYYKDEGFIERKIEIDEDDLERII